MKSIKKAISKNRVKISIAVSPEQVTAYFDNEYARLKGTVEIPGFRRGMAPKVMTIEKIGHGRLAQQSLQKIIDESFRKSLTEHSLYPVTPPSISISKHPAFSEDVSKNELAFEVEFDILPKAKVGNYKNIKVTKIDPKAVEVTDGEVDKVVNYLRRQAAQLQTIDRAVGIGDWAELSFEGSIQNVAKDKLSSKNLPIVIGETKLIPGFEDKIIRMSKGETKEFEISLPGDFYDKEFAGKKVKFKVTLIDVKQMNLPEINKEFLQRFGLKSEKELKANIKKGLISEKKEKERQVQVSQVADQIIKMTKADIPKSLIANEKARMKEALVKDLADKGMTLEKYLQSLKVTENKMDKDLEAQAQRNIVLGVGVGEIAKAEKVDLSDSKGTNAVFDYIIEKNAK